MKQGIDLDLEPSAHKIRYLRWYICGLVFLATVINYVDRQVFSILAPDLQRDIGWSELQYGRIVIAFQFSYATMMIISGGVIDKIGTRLGYALALIWWSIAEMGHAIARGPLGFGVARFFLGVGEAANFPAAIKTIAEWFPKSETGLATGILNGAPTLGAIMAPIIVPLIAAGYGWQGAFVLTGVAGLVWLVFWLYLYRRPEEHSRLSGAELKLIQNGATPQTKTEKVPWASLLGYRQTWAYSVGKILADPAWFFYLFWLPKFLAQKHDIRGTDIIPYLTTVYVLCGIGSLAGGLISSTLIKRGWTVNWSRKTAMAIAAVIMPIVIFAGETENPWTAVIMIGIVTAAHQAWSTTIFTIATDMFPSRAVGSVVGIGGALGSAATILAAELTGEILQRDPNNYMPMFIACGVMYLLALIIIHFLVPKMERAQV